MSKPLIKSKKLRYGSITLILTALIIAAVVLFNVICSALAVRFGWYIDMTSSLAFTLSDECFDYIDEYILPEIDGDEKVTILFCDEERFFNQLSQSSVQYYVYKTARDLAAKYDFIEIDFLNIWVHPSEAKKYGITASTNVSVINGDDFVTYKINQFFTFASADTTVPIAYNGEKRFAVGMMTVTQPEKKHCYFTVNHGEAMYDYELMGIAADAGYAVGYLDLLNFDIPEDCDLLITFNPTQDMTVEDGVSHISEIKKLEKYMSDGGHYMVFASADTFVNGARPNMEGFLSEWGVEFRHEYNEEDGVEYCANIKDITQSTSTDGYTILGEYADAGRGAEILSELTSAKYSPVPIFSNATCIDFPSDFAKVSNGNYKNASNGRTASTLLLSGPSAEVWAGGKITDRGSFPLMTLTEGGESDSGASLLACASVDFATESSLQSTVFGNGPILLSVMKSMGKENIPTSLTFKPFDDTTIDSITTAQMTYITLALALVPALAAITTATVILVRRKNS